MTKYLLEFAVFFISLGFVEAVVKPIAKRFVQRRILSIAPILLKKIDHSLPAILASDDIEARVREMAEELTGESWSGVDLGPLFEMFDLREVKK